MTARFIVACCAVLAMPVRLCAQALPLGSELQVNTYTTGAQKHVAAAGSSDTGDFVVVWASRYQDGYQYGIFGQRVSRTGTALGTEFQINTTTTSSESYPAVAAAPNGDFMVVWHGVGDGSGTGVFGQRYASTGAPLGSQFQVNTYTTDYQVDAAVAADMAGNFVVVWEQFALPYGGIRAQRYDSSGAALGTEFQVTELDVPGPDVPAVAFGGNGNFVVAWEYNDYEISARVFDNSGAPLGSEILVYENSDDEDINDSVFRPSVAVGEAGNFAIAFTRFLQINDDDLYDVRGVFYDSSGQPLSPQITLNPPDPWAMEPSIAAVPPSQFVVVWSPYEFDKVARRFSSTGAPLGEPFRINEVPDSVNTVEAAIAVGTAGEFLVAWQRDPDSNFTDDVFARTFTTSATTPICTAGTLITDAQVKLSKLGAPAGDEKLKIKGRLVFAAGTPATFDPSLAGAQVLVEDLGAGNAVVYELSHRGQPIPPGAGCGAEDGWSANGKATVFKYKNESGALPPGCVASSANGLTRLKLNDRRAKHGYIGFKLMAKDASIGSVVGPLRITLVLGAAQAQGDAGECGGLAFPASACAANGTSFKCQ